MELLKKICDINGASGEEEYVRDYIKSLIEKRCDTYIDKVGNLIAFKKGRKTPSQTVLYAAHMDEVGFMVKKIEDDGTIVLDSIGVSPCVAGAKYIKIRSTKNPQKPVWVNGVIALDPIHHLKLEERSIVPAFTELRVDLGTTNKEETEALVELGDYAYFENNFGKLGNLIKSKALDDRVGCYVMIKMILSDDLEYDSWFAFTRREEIGISGADAVAYSLKPYLTFVLEGTTAGDIPGTDETNKVCKVGNGPAISFMDRMTMYDPYLVEKLVGIARENNLNWQYKSFVSGGNDADGFQRTGAGGRVLAISLPLRYIHSQLCVGSFDDINGMLALCHAADKNLETFFEEE